MNITKTDLESNTAIIKIQIEKNDYEPKILKELKDYQHKAQIKGFRPGMVPMGIVKKMYMRPLMIEEINKLISESLFNYIYENKLRVIGEPLPIDRDPIDWDVDTEFDFSFEIGMSPEIDANLTTEDNFDYYNISVDDNLIKMYTDSYTSRFGSYKNIDVSEDSELLFKGDIIQLDNEGKYLENGIESKDISFLLTVIKDEEIKSKFIGKKAEDKIVFNPKLAFTNITDLTSMLKIDKSNADLIEGDFEFTVKEISVWVEAEINQELFDKMYGKDVIKSEEEFKEKIIEEINNALDNERNYKFRIDAKEKLLSKYNIELPHDFIKRWLAQTEKVEELSPEKIEEEYPIFEKDMRWQIIRDTFINNYNITISDEEIQNTIKEALIMQYRQYGINIPEEALESYSKEILEKKEEKRRYSEMKYEEKFFDFIKNSVTLDIKEISHEDFKNLFN